MPKQNMVILGPLTQCGCKGDQRQCSEGKYHGNDAGTPCKHYRNLSGLVGHCTSIDALGKKREEKTE